MSTAVSLVKCSSYEPDELRPALDRLLSPVGGLAAFVRSGQRVLIKPNCIAKTPADRPAQTDAAIIIELARCCMDRGAAVTVGDSPAWGRLDDNLDAIGALRPLRALGATVADFSRSRRVPNYPMRLHRRFRIANEALDADVVINLPKLKAHKQLGLTAAIKNIFGCVPGKRKAWWHFYAGDGRNHFAWMLLELFDRIRPALTIVDAVVAMEGDGPLNGRARRLGWLAAGTDAVAVERVCAELVSHNPASLRTLRAAAELGIGQPDLGQIDVLGDSIADLRVSDFAEPAMMPIRFPLLRVLRSTIRNILLRQKN